MAGKNRVLNIPWQETRILNCSFCGRMIARNYWQDDDYGDHKFCAESCANLKRSLREQPSPEGAP